MPLDQRPLYSVTQNRKDFCYPVNLGWSILLAYCVNYARLWSWRDVLGSLLSRFSSHALEPRRDFFLDGGTLLVVIVCTLPTLVMEV